MKILLLLLSTYVSCELCPDIETEQECWAIFVNSKYFSKNGLCHKNSQTFLNDFLMIFWLGASNRILKNYKEKVLINLKGNKRAAWWFGRWWWRIDQLGFSELLGFNSNRQSYGSFTILNFKTWQIFVRNDLWKNLYKARSKIMNLFPSMAYRLLDP